MKKQAQKYSLDNSLGNLATRLSRVILKQLNSELQHMGYKITSEQWTLLVLIWNQNGQSQQALADALYKDKTTMARLTASVESLGLIARKPGEKDGRKKVVRLTAKGKKIMGGVTSLAQGLLNIAGRGISESYMAICRDVLRRAYKNITEMSKI